MNLARLFGHMAEEGFLHSADKVKPLVIDKAEDIVPTLMQQGADGEASGRSEINGTL
ncbi:hypothetical protein [Jiella mangrovi]|uniref:hypothetical protein n=1 Tax=Jiella mangrovi TaxID=2821407 RepID=UPI001FD776FD|nr:hypothetical protein [Jiella mangrovi]